MKRWYLARAKAGQQDRAEYNLGAQSFEVYNPKWIVETKTSTKVKPVFDRYLFVRFDPDLEPASLINSTRGISKLVDFGGDLVPIPDEAIALVQARYRKPQLKERMIKGQATTIMDGAFTGLEAIFDGKDGEQRSFLLLDMIGKQHRLSFRNEQFN